MEKDFSKNSQNIKKLFNDISNDYDKLNNIMTFGLHKEIKRNAISSLDINLFNVYSTYDHDLSSRSSIPVRQPKILDLCTGTGDLAGLLKKKYPDAQVIGVDFSHEMLKIAKEKYSDIEFLETDCTKLPFENEQFDLCIISFGLRNVENIEKVLQEIHRVLKKGGCFINIDLGKPNKFFNLFFKPYMYLWVSLLGKVFHGDETPYKYLAVSNEEFPSQNMLVELFKEIGFVDVKNKNYVFGQIASQISYKL